ncbi:hypothetical protein [Acetivibrio cellulolyticus]|uniref:hypothetical protein n=1 Tax=Acetivibrio cellulolyticus TaxID=35830 RepID=UPI0001E2F64E|nr:hypothetical protein [Acetivibrio cellulolyticus]
METEVIKPSKIFYVVSGVILVIGIILFVIILISGIFSSVDKINNQVIVPGTKIIELKETGKYSIYFEYRSVIDGKVFETNNISGLMCSLRNAETEELIKLDNSSVNSNYSVNGREGKRIFEFAINEPGKYELKAWYEEGEGEEAVLAIGKGFGMTLVRTIVVSLGTLFISFGASFAIFIITLVKRKKAKSDILARL